MCKLKKGSVLSASQIERERGENTNVAYLFYFAVPATAVEQCSSQRSEQHGDLFIGGALLLRFLQWREGTNVDIDH